MLFLKANKRIGEELIKRHGGVHFGTSIQKETETKGGVGV